MPELLERIISISLIVILLFALAKFKYNDFRKKQKQRNRFERGFMLESKAKTFLENQGYLIIDEQKIYNHNYEVNGEPRSSKLKVDYVVEKKGKRYIVEVKSGKSAISLDDKNSRRQLLEYDFVIENEGVFLLDMENGKMQFVKFYTKAERNEDVFRKVIIGIALFGILIPFWKVKILIVLILLGVWLYTGQAKEVIKTLMDVKRM